MEAKLKKKKKKKELVMQSADTRENEILAALYHHLSCEATIFEQSNVSNAKANAFNCSSVSSHFLLIVTSVFVL